MKIRGKIIVVFSLCLLALFAPVIAGITKGLSLQAAAAEQSTLAPAPMIAQKKNTARPTMLPTPSPSPTPKPTLTPKPTRLPTPSPSPSPTPEPLPEETPSPTPAPTPTPEPTHKPGDVVMSALSSAKGPFFSRFGLSASGLMQGVYSTIGIDVEIPGYILIDNAVFEGSYSCSDMIYSALSSFTVYVNDQPVFSSPVVYRSEGTSFRFKIFPNILKSGSNRVEIRGYSRLANDDNCLDEYVDSNWIQFGAETGLTIEYELSAKAEELSDYPFPFVSSLNPQGEGLVVAVPDRMDEAELEAALIVLGDLGTRLSGGNQIQLTTWSQADASRVIFVGLRKNTPDDILALLGETDVSSDSALILRASDEDRDTLAIIGDTANALLDGARLISDETRVKQLSGNQYSVKSGMLEKAAERALQREKKDTYTVLDLLGEGISFKGPFHHEVEIQLPVGNDYALTAKDKFTFNIRYSEDLDFDNSSMNIYWGDILLASKSLTKAGAGGDALTFSPPADAIGKSGSALRVEFELSVNDLPFKPRQPETPWANISETSSFYLPGGQFASVSLNNWPAPFRRGENLNDLLVVVPDELTAPVLNLLGRTIAKIGADSPYGSLRLLRASEFQEEDLAHNLLVVGGPENDLIKQINTRLSVSYVLNYEGFKSNEQITVNESKAGSLGSMQVLSNPYSGDHAMLVMTSPSETGIALLTELVSEAQYENKISGNTVLIDPDHRVAAYQYIAAEKLAEASSSELLSGDSDSSAGEPGYIVYIMIGVGVALILLILILIIVLRLKGGKEEEKKPEEENDQ